MKVPMKFLKNRLSKKIAALEKSWHGKCPVNYRQSCPIIFQNVVFIEFQNTSHQAELMCKVCREVNLTELDFKLT